MAHSERDQRGRPHSGKACPESAAGGCQWCGTGVTKRGHRRRNRAAAKRDTRARREDG